MPKYKVISLGNIPDGQGGFEVNDAHYTGDEIELNEISLSAIMKALKTVGQLAKHVTRQSLYIDWEAGGERSIYIRGRKRQHWLWELRDESPRGGANLT